MAGNLITSHAPSAPPTGARDIPSTPCRPSCCKTPYGHATGRDAYPEWHALACKCHPKPKPPVAPTETSTYE